MLFKLHSDKNQKTLKSVELSSLDQAEWLEKDLENVLVERIELLVREDQLMVISQERRGQEEADILAIDQQGVLYIFEIKRWESEESNLLQVIRYGQKFGQYDYDQLNNLFSIYRKSENSNLQEEHKNYFDLSTPLPEDSFNNDQRFIIVTAGLDVKTLQSIKYWQTKNLPISSITYHVYKHGKEYLIDFHSFGPEESDYEGLLTNDYIVNTNSTYMASAYQNMLENCKASAYYDRKHSVDYIKKGDRVFLYHTGIGVIAVGKALQSYRTENINSDVEEEHYIPLQFQFKADPQKEPEKCVEAWEINEASDTSYRFRQTCFSIPSEVADNIMELIKTKHSK